MVLFTDCRFLWDFLEGDEGTIVVAVWVAVEFMVLLCKIQHQKETDSTSESLCCMCRQTVEKEWLELTSENASFTPTISLSN